ncbi:TonB-dependent receptor, partial [Tepidimonas sp.]|uniref:TonB-dependent receptor n=1 Tax=Tepidimonas sp. TaxID=2002775 RepID=UPI003919A2AB
MKKPLMRAAAAAVADVLARVPGVTISRNGGPGTTTNVFLRGAEGRFTAVFIDGVRIDSQSTGGATWNAIPLSQVERIEVLRGPAAAIYGSDALAGVVQIFTREGEGGFFPSVRAGWGSDATRTLGVALRGGAAEVDYAFGVGTERSDGFNAHLQGNPDRDGYRNENLSGR